MAASPGVAASLTVAAEPAASGGTSSAPDGESAPASAPHRTSTSTPAPTATSTPASATEPDLAAGPGRLFRSPEARPDQPGARDEAGSAEARPERGARVVGAVVAVCALLVLGLGSAAFMALPNHDDSTPPAAAVGDGTVPQLTEGATAQPSGSASASGGDRPSHGSKTTKPGRHQDPHTASVVDSAHPDKASGTKAAQAAGTNGGGKATSKPSSEPAATHAASSATVPGDAIVGYASSKCVEVSAHAGADGSPLRLWGCDGDAWQKWVFKSDGSVRSMGLCLDIANASQDNGAAVQLATCNGGWAQKFNLNSSHDLVNSVIGKCVDAKDAGTANGTRLQLWDCSGTSNQKWRLA
ncbi:ricin-type beta-trefoil lectin domain protein [Streptomyces sp. NPDC086777]|uniref:ricin-type beta-trefoil lectin domain protein n=1 Tax=Streptomyces sp. NPDC086777 TaxID=3154866 RepID=UPI00344E4115